MHRLKLKLLSLGYAWLHRLGYKPPGKTQDRYTTKMIGLGEMVGSVIHEVSNPMFSLFTSAQQLRAMQHQPLMPKDEFLRTVVILETNLQRINNILTSLKNYCRDEVDPPYSHVSLKEIFLDAIDLSQEQLRKNSIRFLLNMDDENVCIECRPSQILQCILNLLNNAIHAIGRLDDKWITIGVHSQNKNVRIVVSDSGQGIPKNIQDKIMTPFFTTKTSHEGIGLGLSLSKRIIDAHNGTFSLDTAAKHTTFFIILPKRQVGGTPQELAA